MSLLISGGAIIDGVADKPIEGHSIWIERGRIEAIARPSELRVPTSVRTIDVAGKYVIPGLMDANVHLIWGNMEHLVRHEDRYEDLIAEAAQVALKSGLTTVFDTLGPRRPLAAVQDDINCGKLQGSRIYCAGNIIGLDGFFSPDMNGKALEVASAVQAERINALWVENVGPALTWMTPEQVAAQVRSYIGKGIDFIKYASGDHRWGDPTTSLVFSPRVQAAIVEEAHRAGITAQAHPTGVESLYAAVEAGCDLIQHCNISGQIAVPATTIELMVERGTGAVVFPFTQRRFNWIMQACPIDRVYFSTSDLNCRNLIESEALLLLATDGGLYPSEIAADPMLSKVWLAPGEDNLAELGEGHFLWRKAMEEKGLPPMEILRSSTRNIAVAYKKDKDLGTLEPGKIADMLILEKNPLESAENYRSIHMILKGGAIVDRSALPVKAILTKPPAEPSAETLTYRALRHIGNSRYPACH